MANQCYLPATKCSGSGPTTVYVSQKVAMRAYPTAFYFPNNGSCYLVNPAGDVANPPPPSTATFVGAIPAHYPSCNTCAAGCSVTPNSAYFDCSGTGSQTINVTGGAGETVYLSTSSNWIVLNGAGPQAGGVSTTITLDASGAGSFTIATSGALNGGSVPCPAGPVSVNVSTSEGGGGCGVVQVSTSSTCCVPPNQWFLAYWVNCNNNSGWMAVCAQSVGTAPSSNPYNYCGHPGVSPVVAVINGVAQNEGSCTEMSISWSRMTPQQAADNECTCTEDGCGVSCGGYGSPAP